MNPAEHLRRLAKLLELEADAEAEQLLEQSRRMSAEDAERSGVSLTGLVVRDETAGLGGRAIVTLAKRNQTQNLPWNRLGSGTPVLISEEGASGGTGWRGVVTYRDEREIQIACAQSPETDTERPTFRVNLSSDEISRQRQRTALDVAAKADRGRLAQLRDVLLGVVA